MSQADLKGVEGRAIEGRGRAASGSSPPGNRLGRYLRRLREGYGYTLRKVEERASSLGESIDNSQLSRFEKGKAVPSFEKLRALARIFNVSVQNFSDILDLEEYARFKPAHGDFEALLASGADWLTKGEHGRAFVTFERALEVAEAGQARHGVSRTEKRIAEARGRMARALAGMGKIHLTESELRSVLRRRQHLDVATVMKCMHDLSDVYRMSGDYYLAKSIARDPLEWSVRSADIPWQIVMQNKLGCIYDDEGDPRAARGYFAKALALVDTIPDNPSYPRFRATTLCNLGGCSTTCGDFDAGFEMLRQALALARRHGMGRLVALISSRFAEGHYRRGNYADARKWSLESDTLAGRDGAVFADILFMNAYLRWRIAIDENNDTQERIAFGRLRHLRSRIERTFPEVQEFDRFVERTRRNHG